eukprot:m.156724 g.156724  ORF g.156724 m.156724 type:complete len:332 (+) comp14330_c1_seq4:138-1133(+)
MLTGIHFCGHMLPDTMGTRKVLNKYYPPDFDPSKIPRMKLGKNRQYKVRLMAPFHMRCTNCGHYVYKGTKFLATKETAYGEEYLGLYVFRFYIKCPACCSEITFKTDPKNSDYTCEHGATRNFEAWRLVDKIGTMDDELEEEEEEANPMKALEERTKESKREMDILDALEDIKDANARLAKVDVDELLAQKAEAATAEANALAVSAEETMRQEEEALIQEHFYKGKVLRRLDEDGDASKDEATPSAALAEGTGLVAKKSKRSIPLRESEPKVGRFSGSLSKLVKLKPSKTETPPAQPKPASQPSTGLVSDGESDSDASNTGGLVAYDSDSE